MARVKRAVNAHKKRRVVLERLPATAASAPACTVRPRSSCCTPLPTTSATARLARATSASCGSSASNAAVRAEGITYNRFIQGLHLAGIELDRRALAELAVSDPEAFKAIVEQAKAALPADVNAPKEPEFPRRFTCELQNPRSGKRTGFLRIAFPIPDT